MLEVAVNGENLVDAQLEHDLVDVGIDERGGDAPRDRSGSEAFEGVVRRVGSESPVAVDVRILAATHRDLPAMVARGEFREDLYFRLQGPTLIVPPLRDRLQDLETLVAHFQGETKSQHLRLTRAACGALQANRWPGNVRELRTEVAR